ncbi:MAG: hypothetical protein COX17_05685 [Deltaproteobacteria bacterium CG23_combo_of_CG06-09_8_20_14_all_60_8]|nr:MAG: hypothetical protein COX17_05685 [Deltaproteobacteria bacterium CG23_combo_of_CG06-09_8_20_14_all_60_8]
MIKKWGEEKATRRGRYVVAVGEDADTVVSFHRTRVAAVEAAEARVAKGEFASVWTRTNYYTVGTVREDGGEVRPIWDGAPEDAA